MANSIHDLLSFVAFTHEIRAVKRAMWVKGEEAFENDSEHGYQLAMVAMYVIEQQRLPLDIYKAMGLAIVHDVLEVHSGDTPVFGSAETLFTKEAREKTALATLKQQWPRLKFMHELINEYESKITDESKFIYALDKLVPVLNNYLDDGRNWKRQGATLQRVIAVKKGKIDIDPTINNYYAETLELLRQRPELFGKHDRRSPIEDLSSHGIVALVRNDEGKFLLLEDAREQMKGHWAPPHGRCEPTDMSEEAGVVREVAEETGLTVTPVRKVLTQPADTKVKTVSFWLVETTTDTIIKLDEESSHFGWYTPDEALRLLLYPGTKVFFEKVLKGEINL